MNCEIFDWYLWCRVLECLRKWVMVYGVGVAAARAHKKKTFDILFLKLLQLKGMFGFDN